MAESKTFEVLLAGVDKPLRFKIHAWRMTAKTLSLLGDNRRVIAMFPLDNLLAIYDPDAVSGK